MNHPFDQQIESFLQFASTTNRLRTLEPIPEGLIDLCSNDYLGLSRDPELAAALKEGIDIYGAGSTASRLVRGHREVFERVENAAAAWIKTEAALIFANGYAANVGAISAICDGSYVAFVDRLAHASLLDGIRLSGAKKVYYRHNDMAHLEELLERHKPTKSIIITESLFSMDGDFAPMDGLAELKERHRALLYIDDAHTIGLYGERGKGLAAASADFVMFTFGKALGLEGAVLASSRRAREYLLHNARTFIFSTAPLPAIVHAAELAIKLAQSMDSEREAIRMAAQKIRKAANMPDDPAVASHIIPLSCTDEAEALMLAERLRHAGFHARAIRPPTVPTSRVRLSLNATLNHSQLNQLAEVVRTH
jgi:8-amino-7-oxononanoate synthase